MTKSIFTADRTRICVTGHDHNRPDSFPGLGDFIGWAEATVRLPDGEILVAHSAGYAHVSHASPRDLKQGDHGFDAPTGGRSMICRSSDGGKTWSRPDTVFNYRIDDRPTGLLVCEDGTLLCMVNVHASWAGYPKAPSEFACDLGGLNSKQYVLRSSDGGCTWSAPIWVDGPGTFYERAHGRPIRLEDGTVLWATYCEDIGGEESGGDLPLYGAVHRSPDNGVTWQCISTVRRDGKDVDEPAIEQLNGDRLIMVARPDGGILFSDDRGLTWADSGRTVKVGGPTFRAPQIFRLGNETLAVLATWHVDGVGPDRPYLCGWISHDGGMTWSDGEAVDASCYGYPGGFVVDDGTIFASYCESAQPPNRVYVMRIRLSS